MLSVFLSMILTFSCTLSVFAKETNKDNLKKVTLYEDENKIIIGLIDPNSKVDFQNEFENDKNKIKNVGLVNYDEQ